MHNIWNQGEWHIDSKFTLCKFAFSKFEMQLQENLKLTFNLWFLSPFTHRLCRRYKLFI